MSWSPCVLARVLSVCPRHAQGHAMVPPWCDQDFPLVPLWVTYPPLKSNTDRFHCFWRRHQYAWGDIMEYLNKYKLNSKIALSPHLHQLHSLYKSGARSVHVWLSRGARTVRIWLARGACLTRTWPPHLALGVWTTNPLGLPCSLSRLSWVQGLPMRPFPP